MSRRETGLIRITTALAAYAVLAVLSAAVAAADEQPARGSALKKTPPAQAKETRPALFQKLLGIADADSKTGAAASPDAAVEKRITLQTAGTDVGAALRLVAEQGGLNLVIGPGVEGQVSAYLEDVPVQTALRALAVKNGFEYSVEEGVITVARSREQPGDLTPQLPPVATRIFTLQWQDAQRVREALEYALSPQGKIKVLNENSEGGYQRTSLSDLSGDLDSSATSSNYRTASNTQTTGTVGLGTSGAAQETARNARKLLVTDTLENLQLIADLIADLDQVPPQVLVEARIVEMSTDLQRQLGIDWDVNVLANGPVLNHTLPLEWRAGFSPGNQIRYHADGRAMTSNSLALGTIDFSRFQAMVRVHETDNAIRLLANPRLLVFNNHSASILVGERYPLLQANITDQGTLTEAFDTYIPVGIQLEVTPSIMSDGRITMLVHPATSALGDEVVGTTGLRVRRILTREIDTRIIMQDGQTVVLGGLISDRKVRTINKIPGLGDLPILDALFRQESPGSQRVDLLVFLTAYLDKATEISERDRQILDLYRPQFKHYERLQDVPVHFEIPTEYQEPKPMFGDAHLDDAEADIEDPAQPTEDTAPPPAASSTPERTKVKEERQRNSGGDPTPKPPPGQRAALRPDAEAETSPPVPPVSNPPRRGSVDQPPKLPNPTPPSEAAKPAKTPAAAEKPTPRIKRTAQTAKNPYRYEPASAPKTTLAGIPEEIP